MTGYTAHRAEFESLLAGLEFVPGHRAQDFDPKKDKAASHILDVVFGGRTHAEIAVEAAEQAEELKRLAALPKPRTMAENIKLALGGIMGLAAVGMLVFAFGRRGGGTSGPRAGNGIERAIRSSPRA